MALKEMAHSGILHYIPRKRTNYITFVTRRIESDEITLPREVYVDRRKQYERRIASMIQYVTDKDKCHSQFLLAYFGERDTDKCGRCDICIGDNILQKTEDEIREAVLRQLQNGPVAAPDMDYTSFNRNQFAKVVHEMVRHEEIALDQDQRFVLPSIS